MTLENSSDEAPAVPAPQPPPARQQLHSVVAEAAFEAEQVEAGQPRIGTTSRGKQQRGKVLVPRFGGTGSVVVGADDLSDTESANRAPELEKKGGEDSDRDDDDSYSAVTRSPVHT